MNNKTGKAPALRCEAMVRRVWYAPTARRHFFSKWACCIGEARARIKRKHPSERSETDDCGRLTYRGWHWTELPNSEKLLKRYARLISRHTPNAAGEPMPVSTLPKREAS